MGLLRARLFRRPLLLLFVFGCAVSAGASGRFNVRLMVDGALSFLFIPVIELAAFACVYAMAARRELPFADAVNRFFAGNTPWLLWLVAIAAAGCFVPPQHMGRAFRLLEYAAVVPILWSMVIDFRFFRDTTAHSPRHAIRDVIRMRAIAWPIGIAYFFGIAIWSDGAFILSQWVRR